MPAYTQEQARLEIAKLVEQFKQNKATLLDKPEAQIEDTYIRQLFGFLNWNVHNAGLSEPQWEFVLQRTDRTGNRPDYIMQLDGQWLFVMDAKKVKYEMHDPRWLNQVYAYAYSTQNSQPSKKIDFAILTDFQEFIVLDCTLLASKPEALNNFRVLDWRYTDYVERFDELWELFERSNVLAAMRERKTGIWSRYLSPKQVKANRVPPDKAFLSALDDEKTGWRVRLAKDMKKHNQQLDGSVLTAAVQLLIDRLVFVKVLSDREIEEDYLTKMAEIVERDGLAEDNHGWFVACKNLFAELNAMYNGSIFAPRPELESVVVSNKVVREVLSDLLPENSPYNFAVLPVEILGTIYERFLGRVVHATDARVKIEDKPEVRKAGGVYYTPQYIVNYIVANTVGKLLGDCKTPADVARLKILDPACGSGSFLLGAYTALIEWHKAYYTGRGDPAWSPDSGQPHRVTKRDHDAYYLDEDGRVRLTAKLKRQILLNNIFGVDIDAQAVEVTRLSLSLKALEDTRSDEAHQERTLFNQTLLPDLGDNIKCGNSLIGTDYLVTSDEELRRVKPFDWASAFPEIFHRRDAEGAEETQGFDAVIGNPPWVALSGKFGVDTISRSEIQYMLQRFSGNSYMPNLFEHFIAQSLNLLKIGGFHSFIVPDRLAFNKQYAALRKRILGETTISSLYFKAPFPGIIADTLVYVFQRNPHGNDASLVLVTEHDKPPQQVPQSFFKSTTDTTFQYNRNAPLAGMFDRIDRNPTMTRLSELCDSTSGFGGKSSLITNERQGKTQIATLKGDSIGRYEHRKQYWFEFKKSNITGRTTDPTKLGANPKVLLRKTGDRLIATLDASGIFPEQSLYFLYNFKPNIEPRYILGLVNSNLLTMYFRDRLATNIESIAQIKKFHLDILPIRTINFADAPDKARRDRVVALVEQMLDLHKRLHAAKTETDRELYQRQIDATDQQIDALVYELYGLTDEEIKIVEGG